MINVQLLNSRDWLDIDELVECLNISKSTIYRIKRRGDLKGIRWGGRVCYRSTDVRLFLVESGILPISY